MKIVAIIGIILNIIAIILGICVCCILGFIGIAPILLGACGLFMGIVSYKMLD